MGKIKVKPCGICGEMPVFLLTDEEGNLRNESYLENPYSGILYCISHPTAEGNDCPLGTGERERLSMWGYDTLEEAKAAWNRIWEGKKE